VRQNPARVAVASVLILVPCFWQKHAGFGDFPSHVYNAWLYPKVESGELQGLAASGQHTNILCDVLLTWLIPHVGVVISERLVLSAAVLLMFWGMFAAAAALSGRTTWMVAPFLAMLCYGWAFQLGFLNSYLSTAFCFLIFALLWLRPQLPDLLATAVLLIAAVLAHPAALVWLIGTLVFGWIVRASPAWARWAWFAAGIAILIGLNRFAVAKLSAIWYRPSWLSVTSADQFYLFRARFFWLAIAIAVLWLAMLVSAAKENGWRDFVSSPAVLL